MSDLLGAWSLTDRLALKQISEGDKRAMMSHLPGHAGGLTEFAQGRAWIVASRSKLIGQGAQCLAFEGLIVPAQDERRPLDYLFRDYATNKPDDVKPEGHYALALALPGGDGLVLLRSLSGGERLYYTQVGDVVLFASSIRPILAHSGIRRRFNWPTANQVLVSGLSLFGTATLVKGVDEVLPGHTLKLAQTVGRQRWHWQGLLEPPEGDIATLAKTYRDRLTHDVERAIGNDSTVAVTLSGGIDSSAIAAAAVDVVGAKNVVAITYEFDDRAHYTETHYASEVCCALGITDHRIFQLGFREFLQAIPEAMWRAESIVHWPKAFMLTANRQIRDYGFSKYLCGFGIGSHMAYFEDLANAVGSVPFLSEALTSWTHQYSRPVRWRRHLGKVHPALEPAYPRLRYLVLTILRNKGLIGSFASYFPAEIRPLLDEDIDLSRTEPYGDELSLIEQLREHSFAHLLSCIDVTRWEKPLREVGASRISPAHFANSLPYSYLPPHPPPAFWSHDRRLRPGKLLLREAMKNTLPDSVLYRRKKWDHAVVSPRWMKAGLRWIRDALPNSDRYLGIRDEAYLKAIRALAPRAPQASVTALRLWHRMFIELPLTNEPPSWESIGVRQRDSAEA